MNLNMETLVIPCSKEGFNILPQYYSPPKNYDTGTFRELFVNGMHLLIYQATLLSLLKIVGGDTL